MDISHVPAIKWGIDHEDDATQIQGQLFVTERHYCDLVVWMPKGRITQRIYLNANFTRKMLRKLANF